MIALPDYIVLEFIEWLSKSQKRKNEAINALSAGQEDTVLKKYAEEYLIKMEVDPIRKRLRSYISSKDFETAVSESLHNYNSREIFSSYFEECFEECFKYRSGRENSNQEINSDKLVQSFVRYCNDASGCTDIFAEIEFFNSLKGFKGGPINLQGMPLHEFEDLVDTYLSNRNDEGFTEQRRRLIKAFKQSDSKSLFDRCSELFSTSKVKEIKSLQYINDRYFTIGFKCLFLPLAADEDFKASLSKYWLDLDSLSGNYLDIFYSVSQLNESGYKIKEQFQKLNVPENVLPCLVLWSDKLEDARFIEIRDLTDDEVFHLVSEIVQRIKDGNQLNEIYKEAKAMVAKETEKKRSITNIHQTVENNSGLVVGTIEKSQIEFSSGDISHTDTFYQDVEKAIEIINHFSDIQQEHRKALIDLMTEAKEAMQADNEKDQKSCKEKFKYFVFGAGNAVKSILSALSSLTTVAQFFNIPPLL